MFSPPHKKEFMTWDYSSACFFHPVIDSEQPFMSVHTDEPYMYYIAALYSTVWLYYNLFDYFPSDSQINDIYVKRTSRYCLLPFKLKVIKTNDNYPLKIWMKIIWKYLPTSSKNIPFDIFISVVRIYSKEIIRTRCKFFYKDICCNSLHYTHKSGQVTTKI